MTTWNTPHSFASSLRHWASLPHLYVCCKFPSIDSAKEGLISHSVVLQCYSYLQVSWYHMTPTGLTPQVKACSAMNVLRQHDMSSFVFVSGHLLLVHTEYSILQACLCKCPRSTLLWSYPAGVVRWHSQLLQFHNICKAAAKYLLTIVSCSLWSTAHSGSCALTQLLRKLHSMLVSLTSNIQGYTLCCTWGEFCCWPA